MKHPGSNPRTEGRRPKEARNPNSDLCEQGGTATLNAWARDLDDPTSVLKDGPPPPRIAPQALAGRTALLGEAIVRFAKKIPVTAVHRRSIEQLVGAETSVGANLCEADDAVSGKEFKQKIGTCRKESKETMLLRMVATAEPDLAAEARECWREAKELNLIFGAIWRK